ncbi:MAG: YggS family pyridoxal phosphate-dependent enzyme [Alphaproteobacteria bacterium]
MSITENLTRIKSLNKTAKLIAVSKTQPLEKIREALNAGHKIFGENRVQEATTHWAEIKQTSTIELHLIGPLQTNKVKEAIALFDCIQTVDREKLARALGAEMKKQNKNLPCFIQVNTGEEEQKSGIAPADLPTFLKICREDCGLNIIGLMCIPPVDEPPALHFALLKKLGKENNLENLSMGMSSDFEKALALGATHIRLGTAIFGERHAV